MTYFKRQLIGNLLIGVVFVAFAVAAYLWTRASVDAELYRSAVAISSDAIVLVKVRADPYGTVDVWSRGAEKLLGWKASEIEGKSVSLIIPALMRSRHEAAMGGAVRSGQFSGGAEVQYVTCNALHKDGREIPVVTNIRMQRVSGVLQFSAILDERSKVKVLDVED